MDEQPPPAPAGAPPAESRARFRLHLPNLRQTILSWLPLTIALISLGMGVYNFIMAGRAPELTLIWPDKVRIAQGGPSGPLLYMQPAFVATGPGGRPELITRMTLEARPLDGPGTPATFVWREQGSWRYDPATRELSWLYTGDAAPFIVAAQSPALFTALLIGPSGWSFAPGRYRLTLIAERGVNARSLTGTVDVSLWPEAVEYINASEGTRFMDFAVTPTR